jgi:hypothetical protein
MNKKVFFISVCIVFFVFTGKAQILKPVPISYWSENGKKQQFINTQIFTLESASTVSKYKGIIISNNFKCTLPKGAIFCRMEDAIHNHLNFWVKFRMGSDDKYSN